MFYKDTKLETDGQDSVNVIENISNNKTEVESHNTDSSNHDPFTDDSDFCLVHPQEIIQIHIDKRQTSNFHIIINKNKILTLWETVTSKFAISRACLVKQQNTNKL